MTREDQRPPAAVLFDALGADYEKAFAHAAAHLAALEWLVERLPPAARVLDVGSGTGRPTAAALVAAGHSVLGVDVSPVMVELAGRQVPEAEFHQADIRELALGSASFDGVCVFFSLLQMSRAEQSALLRRLGGALRPGGCLVPARQHPPSPRTTRTPPPNATCSCTAAATRTSSDPPVGGRGLPAGRHPTGG